MLDFARTLTPISACSYVAWCLGNRRGPIVLATRSGARFELRPNSSGNNDYGVAYEIFVHNYYKDRPPLSPDDVRLVVDLGANVGYSLLYFLHAFPKCRIMAFEPHPRHAEQVLRNLAVDGSRERVDFYAKGAGAATRSMRLTDNGSSSSVTAEGRGTLEVEVVDIFALLAGKHIDLLKIDIEGGEYEILADPRFEQLDVAAIVMEWHSRGGGIADKRWCEERIRALGYDVEDIFTHSTYGMFYTRPRARAALPAGSKHI